jgi:uncharacterized protein (TIGR03067 family)
MCLATRGGRRPADFATKPGTGFVLQTLERKMRRRATAIAASQGTAASGRPEPARAVVSDPPSGVPTSWEGEWAMVGAVFSGAAMAQDMVKWCQRITRGDLTTVVAGPQVMLKARFSLDASRTPNGVDYMNLDGAHKGKPQQGIFELTGDELRVCMAPPGKTRPAEFSSKAGDGRSYTTWRILTGS